MILDTAATTAPLGASLMTPHEQSQPGSFCYASAPAVVPIGRHPSSTLTAIGAHCAPLLIAGPCAVDSREQILTLARAAKAAGAGALRGGAYKPRTSPYTFQGLGVQAIEWLHEAREETGLPLVVEITDPRAARNMAEQLDVLQIGARNMANYELLKAVARACAEVGTPVLLKRGFAALLEEWLLAAEYLLAFGAPHVILCERGIRTMSDASRFTLDLAAIPALRQRTPLPILIDPSHAAGASALVPALARAGLAAGADGLLIEIAEEPVGALPIAALCDGEQALTPGELTALWQGALYTTIGDITYPFSFTPTPAPTPTPTPTPTPPAPTPTPALATQMPTEVRALRGAVDVSRDSWLPIIDATKGMLTEMLHANTLLPTDVVDATFTLTPDLHAAFPAEACRVLPGWERVPRIDHVAPTIVGAPERIVRVLLHVRVPVDSAPLSAIYLGERSQLLAEGTWAHGVTRP